MLKTLSIFAITIYNDKLQRIMCAVTLTGTSKARGCRCLHSLPSVVPVFGKTVDNSSLGCIFLPLLSVKCRYKYTC